MDPELRWLDIKSPEDTDQPAEAKGSISLSGRVPRVLVATENVSQLQLDLNRLPDGVTLPLALRIDEQVFQITGAAGPRVELVRAGSLWSVVRKPKPPRTQP
jgi:hypothetical protein